MTTPQIQAIANNESEPHHRRLAAERTLAARAHTGDLADFEEVLTGKKTLKALRDQGIDTTVIKKLKHTKDGIEIEIARNDIGDDFDRIVEQTDGLPTKTVKVEDNRVFANPAERDGAAKSIADQIKRLLGKK